MSEGTQSRSLTLGAFSVVTTSSELDMAQRASVNGATDAKEASLAEQSARAMTMQSVRLDNLTCGPPASSGA